MTIGGVSKSGDSSAVEPDTYEITLDEPSAEFLEVEAAVSLEDGRLEKGFGGAFDWKRGWGDFVTDVSAKDPDGNALEVLSEGEGEEFHWLVREDDEPYAGRAIVSYKVDLAFARTEWPFGNEQAGKRIDGNLYLVTKPLFLTPGRDHAWKASFVLPQGISVTSPWNRTERGNEFFGRRRLELQNNSLIIGQKQPISVDIEGFEFRLQLLGAEDGISGRVHDILQKVVGHYLAVFPGTPKHPYLMTILPARSNDAEAFFNSACISSPSALAPGDEIIWANFISHELFHFWNGQRIRGKPRSETQWFSEGVTDYFAALALVNSGVFNTDDFLRNMEQIVGNYLYFKTASPYDGTTLREAGKDKGRNRFGVYDGGWVAAFVLDTRIRKLTKGDRSLVDLMRALYEDFALEGRVYTLEDLAAVAGRIAGQDMSPFLEAYISGMDVLPVEEVLEHYGLRLISKPYANRTFIVREPNADDEALADFQWLTKRHFDRQVGSAVGSCAWDDTFRAHTADWMIRNSELHSP